MWDEEIRWKESCGSSYSGSALTWRWTGTQRLALHHPRLRFRSTVSEEKHADRARIRAFIAVAPWRGGTIADRDTAVFASQRRAKIRSRTRRAQLSCEIFGGFPAFHS